MIWYKTMETDQGKSATGRKDSVLGGGLTE